MNISEEPTMNLVVRLCLLFSLAFVSTLAQASDPQDVTWEALAPLPVAVENPFEELTEDQMNALRKILRVEMRADQNFSIEARAEVDALRDKLSKEGLDVDGLFAARLEIMKQRETAATAVNEGLVGKTVRLPGYVLPLQVKGKKAVEFLLVPTVGACIHTPPPPANQVVHVVYPDGIEISGLFTPVWISGEMTAEASTQTIGYVDGQAPVSVSYKMRPDIVQRYSN
jgi:hypothetical protein